MRKRKSRLEQQVLETIRRYRMCQAGDRVAVAVSGGADSVALLRVLEGLTVELGITLLVLHFNHQLRGAESDEDERFVAALARAANLEFASTRADVDAEARRHGWNLEDAGRRLRYEFFASVVESGRATRVAVAHTADDQAETVLARLIRGTGLTGLGGVYPVVGHVIRPLLEIRREELRKFLERRDESWREDPSNRDTRRLRARLRHGLLPELEREYSKAIVERCGELARLARDEEKFWTALVEDRFRALVSQTGEGLSIRCVDLLVPLPLSGGAAPGSAPRGVEESSRALAQRLIRRVLAELRSDRQGITAQHVEQVIRLAGELLSGRRIELPGVGVARSFDRLIFSCAKISGRKARGDETVPTSAAYEYVVELPRQGSTAVAVPELGRRFRLKLIDWPVPARDTTSIADVALDVDRLRNPLVLRNWRPGDAYRPRGRGRVLKLKKLFLAGRIAVGERASWPVLTSAGKLVWARGMPPAEEFAAHAETRTGLLIAEEGL